jgi:hypothetical protein
MRTPSLVAAAIVLALTASTALGQSTDPGTKNPPGLKLALPDVKGWERSSPRPLPPESGGYSVGYNSDERIAVTIYVYNRGRKQISDDLSAEEVQKELTGAKEAIEEAKRRGLYESAKEETSGESPLGGLKEGPKALYARFKIRNNSEDTLSEIYILPHRNHFIKVRVTRAADGPASADSALDRLFTDVGKLLGKK